jgi:cell division protein FtsL
MRDESFVLFMFICVVILCVSLFIIAHKYDARCQEIKEYKNKIEQYEKQNYQDLEKRIEQLEKTKDLKKE